MNRCSLRRAPHRGRLSGLGRALVVLVVLTAAAGCGSTDDRGEPDPSSNLDVEAPLLGGGTLDLTRYAGEPVVLWFWAPWCSTCRSEAPHVASVAADYAEQVTIVGIGGRGETDAMERFVEDTGLETLQHLVDADGSVWGSFGVPSQPAFAFIDTHGDVDLVLGPLGRDGIAQRMEQLIGR